jgi:hypothetical protein
MDIRGQAALLTAEVVAIIACAVLPLPVPAQVPLLVMALISFAVRGKMWSDRFESDRLRWAVGAVVGVIALALAWLVVGPVLESRTGGMVGWTRHGMVRGKPDAFLTIAILVAASAIGTELLMRAWILDRIRELVSGRAGVVIAVAVTAIVEAIFVGDPGWSCVGAALVSAALSGLYLASGRSLVAPIAARVTFEVGALLLEAFKLVS